MDRGKMIALLALSGMFCAIMALASIALTAATGSDTPMNVWSAVAH